jgi:hypothetical protein
MPRERAAELDALEWYLAWVVGRMCGAGSYGACGPRGGRSRLPGAPAEQVRHPAYGFAAPGGVMSPAAMAGWARHREPPAGRGAHLGH